MAKLFLKDGKGTVPTEAGLKLLEFIRKYV